MTGPSPFSMTETREPAPIPTPEVTPPEPAVAAPEPAAPPAAPTTPTPPPEPKKEKYVDVLEEADKEFESYIDKLIEE